MCLMQPKLRLRNTQSVHADCPRNVVVRRVCSSCPIPSTPLEARYGRTFHRYRCWNRQRTCWGVFDAAGVLALPLRKPTSGLWREGVGDIAEQSSNDIWGAVCACVRDALVAMAGICAPLGSWVWASTLTCSLVVPGVWHWAILIAVGTSGRPRAQRHRLDGSPRY